MNSTRCKSPSTRDALTRATRSAVSSMSTATARHSASSASKLTAMHPLPVPRSSSVPCAGPCSSINDSAVSTSCQMTRASTPALLCDHSLITHHFRAWTRYESAFDMCHLSAAFIRWGCISLCQGWIRANKQVSPKRLELSNVTQWLASHSSCGESDVDKLSNMQ